MSVESAEIAVIRGGVEGELGERILAFLSGVGGLNEEAARRRLSEAVVVATDGGDVIAMNSVRPAGLQLIGGRRFWIYDCVLAGDSQEQWERMFNAAFEALAAEFEAKAAGYVGVCGLIDERTAAEQTEAVWPGTELMLAGYLDDGRQVRIRYFWGAMIAPGLPESPSLEQTASSTYPLAEGYEIRRLGEPGASREDVLALWTREGAVGEEEANRRVNEVTLVGIGPNGEPVAASSLYLQLNAQLRMELWHYRTFVAREHRHSGFAAQLIFANRDWIEDRFLRGDDRRAPGMLFELENEGLRQYFNKALWLPADFTFIGENERGAHVRVHWFPGARIAPAGRASSI